jgi:hypothetical protein
MTRTSTGVADEFSFARRTHSRGLTRFPDANAQGRRSAATARSAADHGALAPADVSQALTNAGA